MLTNKRKLLFIILFLTSFVGFIPISMTVEVVLLFVIILYYRKELHSGLFNKFVFVVLIGIFLSSISCYFYRNQPIYLTIGISFNYLTIASYFIFKSKKYKVSDIEDALNILGKVVTLLYLIRFVLLQQGILIGGFVDEFQMSNVENVRLRIACSPIIFFLMFKSYHNVLTSKNKKDLIWLALTMLGVPA